MGNQNKKLQPSTIEDRNQTEDPPCSNHPQPFGVWMTHRIRPSSWAQHRCLPRLMSLSFLERLQKCCQPAMPSPGLARSGQNIPKWSCSCVTNTHWKLIWRLTKMAVGSKTGSPSMFLHSFLPNHPAFWALDGESSPSTFIGAASFPSALDVTTFSASPEVLSTCKQCPNVPGVAL